MSKMREDYFVFDGQTASTGEPNKITGRMSFYGRILKFKTKKEALDYVIENDSGMASDICVAGTRRTIRNYCLGSSMEDFNMECDYSEYY